MELLKYYFHIYLTLDLDPIHYVPENQFYELTRKAVQKSKRLRGQKDQKHGTFYINFHKTFKYIINF